MECTGTVALQIKDECLAYILLLHCAFFPFLILHREIAPKGISLLFSLNVKVGFYLRGTSSDTHIIIHNQMKPKNGNTSKLNEVVWMKNKDWKFSL